MASSSRGEFERQRGELLREVAESFEHVLASINRLNRNLEAVITVGNEFSSVEALWSTFENVMGHSAGDGEGEQGEDAAAAEAQGKKPAEEGTGADTKPREQRGDDV